MLMPRCSLQSRADELLLDSVATLRINYQLLILVQSEVTVLALRSALADRTWIVN